MSRPRILISEPIGAAGLALLERSCELLTPWRERPDVSFDEMRPLLSDVDAVIVRLFGVGREDIERAPRLKAIAKHGVGVDSIDCVAATERGIAVLWAPGANSNAVAEHTLNLMLSLARKTEETSLAIKSGRAYRREEFVGVELAGRTIVVIGLGRIGHRVALKAFHGFGMNVMAFDPYIDAQAHTGPAALGDSLETMLGAADFVTLHVPLTDETRDMINAEMLASFRPGTRLINTSRGAVVDEVALVDALDAGTLAGAALDVFIDEPLPRDHPLQTAPNTILSPHIAGSTEEAFEETSRRIALATLDIVAGRRTADIVNPEVFDGV